VWLEDEGSKGGEDKEGLRRFFIWLSVSKEQLLENLRKLAFKE